MRAKWIVVLAAAALGCGSPNATPEEAMPAPAGPKRPTPPDPALDAAPGADVSDVEVLTAWTEARVEASRAGALERVRVPIVRRAGAELLDPRPYAVGADPERGPHVALRIVDRSSMGLPPAGPEGWRGWAEGRIRPPGDPGSLSGPASPRPAGGEDVADDAPLLELDRWRPRAADEPPLARVITR